MPRGIQNFTTTIHNKPYAYIDPRQFNLKGRAVLVTGASKGVGKEAVLSFARAGVSQIAIAARSSMSALTPAILAAASECGRAAPEVLPLELDISDEKNVLAAAEQVKSTFGRLDILVNNAGYMEKTALIADSSPDEWWKSFEVNLKGSYLVSRAFIPLLLSSSDGLKNSILVSSIGAHNISPTLSAYQTSKLALLRFGEFLNAEYAKQGLITIPVHPGAVMTDLASKLPKEIHGILTDEPTLFADTVVWLMAERREWLRGRYVSVTWDMAELVELRKQIEEKDLLKVRIDLSLQE